MRARTLMAVVALVAASATACTSSSKSSSPTSAPTGDQSSTTTPTTAPSSHPAPDSFCGLALHIQSSVPGSSSRTPAELKAIYKNRPQELDEAESKAPSAIKSDFATLARAERQILSALRAANYDLTKIPAATLAGFATAPVQAASLRVQQYVAGSCNTSTPAP